MARSIHTPCSSAGITTDNNERNGSLLLWKYTKGRGTHYAKRTIEKHVNRDYKGTKYGFCGDIYHFYDTLKPQIIMDKMKRLIKDYRVLDLIWHIVKDGILIGLYTSQWFANTILQQIDRAIRDSKLCK